MCFPRALARLLPSAVRVRIRSRSTSASPPSTASIKRPVLVPVRLPAVYIEPRTLPGANTPVVGVVSDTLTYRVGRVSEWIGRPMANHYLLIVGYDHQRFAVVEPVLGYRTISFTKLARYRRPFNDAAIVFSAANQFANGAAVASAH